MHHANLQEKLQPQSNHIDILHFPNKMHMLILIQMLHSVEEMNKYQPCQNEKKSA